MSTHLKKAIMVYAFYYVICSLVFPIATSSFSVAGNSTNINISMGLATFVFLGAILVGFVNGKLSGIHITPGEKLGATFAVIGITIAIDILNWWLQGYFVGRGIQMIFGYILVFPVIGGFLILGGITIGNRVVNGKQPD